MEGGLAAGSALSVLLVLLAGCPKPEAGETVPPSGGVLPPAEAPDAAAAAEARLTPTVIQTRLPYPDVRVPELSDEAIADLERAFGCTNYAQQVDWGPERLFGGWPVVRCCRHECCQYSSDDVQYRNPEPLPVPPGVIEDGCLARSACSLLAVEPDGGVTEIASREALLERFTPVSDPATALGLVFLTEEDMFSWTGDEEDRGMLEDPRWVPLLPEMQGTTVEPNPAGGYDVQTYRFTSCGCVHDVFQVRYRVSADGRIALDSETMALRQEGHWICVD